MAYDYDALYAKQPDALGAPTVSIVKFFADLDCGPCRVLDVGCGQGRDALFVARLGHYVTGVDLSENGVMALRAAAAKEKLEIEGIVADLANYDPVDKYDILLFDRVLHMLSERNRLQAFKRLVTSLNCPGWIVIADEKSNIPKLKQVIEDCGRDFSIIFEKAGYLFTKLT